MRPGDTQPNATCERTPNDPGISAKETFARPAPRSVNRDKSSIFPNHKNINNEFSISVAMLSNEKLTPATNDMNKPTTPADNQTATMPLAPALC